MDSFLSNLCGCSEAILQVALISYDIIVLLSWFITCVINHSTIVVSCQHIFYKCFYKENLIFKLQHRKGRRNYYSAPCFSFFPFFILSYYSDFPFNSSAAAASLPPVPRQTILPQTIPGSLHPSRSCFLKRLPQKNLPTHCCS